MTGPEVDWIDALPAGSVEQVVWSSVCVPDVPRDHLDRDAAWIILRGGYSIDIDYWPGDDEFDEVFTLTLLFDQDWEGPVAVAECPHVGQVVAAARGLAERAMELLAEAERESRNWEVEV